MSYSKKIKRLFTQSNIEVNNQVNDRIINDSLKALDKSQNVQPSQVEPVIWRIIMKSKLSKFTTAAAVILIVAVLIFFLDKSVTPVYGIMDMPRLYEQSKVIHIQGMQYFGSHRMPDGSEIPPVPVDNWIDIENGRSRHTQTGLSAGRDYVNVNLSESISEGQYLMVLNHTEKYVTFFKKSEYLQMLDIYKTSQTTQQQIFGDIEQLQNFEKTGSEKIDGVEYDIWQGEITGSIPIFALKNKFWISPETGTIGRVQMFSKINNGQWDLEFDYSDFEYNIEIPDGIFSMDVPEDYELKSTKETAFPLELSDGGGGLSEGPYSIRANVMIGFRMSDDSIVAGWFSVDENSEILQEDFFTGLEFGGSLPLLPMEIYGLKSSVMNSDIIYTGYHLTYTQKEGKFFEWSLYVPNDTPPQNIKDFVFNAMSKFNLDPKPKSRLGLGVDCSLVIENSDDFDTWVLGAMTELNNNGKPPENITYDRVIELSQQIRKEINQ